MSKSKFKVVTKIVGKQPATTITFNNQQLTDVISQLPDGEERRIFETALEAAREKKVNHDRQIRLNTNLSIESLTPIGWMMVGEHSPLAYGAIREGDFRLDEVNGEKGWVFGPPGAFDREAAETIVMRNVTQAGVMSEVHQVYRVLDPVDRETAIRQAGELEAEWRASLPKKSLPAKVMFPGPDGEMEYRFTREEWPNFYTEEIFARFPEGAKAAYSQNTGWAPSIAAKFNDEVLSEPYRVYVYECDAEYSVITKYSKIGREFAGYGWHVRERILDHVQGYYQRHLMSGPYDCIIGKVWVAALQPGQKPHNGRILVNGQIKYPDYSADTCFPLATREKAMEAALLLAHKDNENSEQSMPDVIPLPHFQDSEPLLAA